MHGAARKLLYARENEVAKLVAVGKSSREIAEALYLSPRTVETHISSIYVKLGIRSRVELVASLLAAERDADTSDHLPQALTSFVDPHGHLVTASNFAINECTVRSDHLSGATEAVRESIAIFHAVEPDSPKLASRISA